MIPLGKPYLGDQELEAVKRVFESGCVAGTCPEVDLFEKEFAEFVGAKYAVATSSCTTALHVANIVCGINNHNNVMVPAYTFPATGLSALYQRANVWLCDVDIDTFNMDDTSMIECKNNIMSQLKGMNINEIDAVIPVHSFGNSCDIKEIRDFLDDTGNTDAKIIEDAACAIPAYFDKKHVGTIGDCGCFSFYAIKPLCTGEGGMFITNNEEMYIKAKSLVDFGKTTDKNLPTFDKIGYNYRLSAIQAAIGRVQLQKTPEMHMAREKLFDLYDSILQDVIPDLYHVQSTIPGGIPAFQRYVIALHHELNRDKIIADLREDGVQAAIGTFDLSQLPVFGTQPPMSNSSFLYNSSISLPMFVGMTDEQVETVCDYLEIAVANQLYPKK